MTSKLAFPASWYRRFFTDVDGKFLTELSFFRCYFLGERDLSISDFSVTEDVAFVILYFLWAFEKFRLLFSNFAKFKFLFRQLISLKVIRCTLGRIFLIESLLSSGSKLCAAERCMILGYGDYTCRNGYESCLIRSSTPLDSVMLWMDFYCVSLF